jgi:stage II sporulation protein R
MEVIMKKGCRLLICLFSVLAVSAIVVMSSIKINIDECLVQAGIASNIIRFHVRANSDTDTDQQLKIKVKNEVVSYIKPFLENSPSIDTSREILSQHIEDIKDTALDTIHKEGFNYNVNVYFEQSYFPMKTYADVTFPPGEYEAFRIDIGEANGKNWWCVLYPPLCFVDSVYGELPESSKEELKNVLTDDEYNAITDVQYKYKFKYLKFLNKFIK